MAARPDDSRAPSDERTLALLCKSMFACDLFLQKVTVPVDPHLPALTAILPVAAVGALLFRIILIDYSSLIFYFVFLAIAAIEDIISTSTDVSIASLSLAALNLLPLVMRGRASKATVTDILNFAADLMCVFAVFGILQMALQGILPKTYLFPVDYLLPDYLLIEGYNNLNTLGYGSDFLKSNGIFLAEPSYLSQVIGLGLILEMSTKRRWARVAVLVGGLYSSVSGTGIIMIAVWSAYLAIRRGKLLLYAALAPIALGLVFVVGPSIGLDTILSRAGEFSDPNSSGFARFVSMFYVLDSVNMTNLKEMLLGRGSGTVFEYAWRFRFEIFDPTWGKLVYEFGIIGFMAFLLFYNAVVPIGRSIFGVPMTVMYFVLGGYLLDASVIGIIVSLLVWIQPAGGEAESLLSLAPDAHGHAGGEPRPAPAISPNPAPVSAAMQG